MNVVDIDYHRFVTENVENTLHTHHVACNAIGCAGI